MPSVIELLNSGKISKGFSKIVEDTYFRLQEGDQVLAPYLPLTTYEDMDLMVGRISQFPIIASVIGEDQEIPARKPNAELKLYQLGDIRLGISFMYKGNDFKIAEKLRMALEAGRMGGQYLQYFFKRGETLGMSLQDAHTFLTLKVMTTGSCTYTDPITGAQLSFAYPDTIAEHFPTALTGNARWSQPSTATGIENLLTWTRTIYDNLGEYPQAWLMSTKTFRQLQVQAATKRKVIALATGRETTQNASLDGVAVGNLESMNRLLGVQDEPIAPVIIYDREYQQENADGTFTKSRFLPQDTVTAVFRDNTERALLPYPENNFQPGIFSQNKIIEEMPLKEVSRAMTCGIPLVADTRKLFSVTVDGAS